MFRRARYQTGSLGLEERKKGPAVWVYRWREKNAHGKSVRRKVRIGDEKRYPTESRAQAAVDALRLDINNGTAMNKLVPTTLGVLWEHYSREELPLKELSTQDSYTDYWKNWISPRWGKCRLDGGIKTMEVERWLRGLPGLADGSKAKIKTVMSALYSHAVRWEFSQHNPISSGIPVGSGGKRGPSTGVRVSSKRRKAPLALSAEQVTLGLSYLEFRDQLLVFIDGALGTRRGELGALRWMDCDFAKDEFRIENSYYWRRGGHLKTTKTEASAKPLPMHAALKQALLEWRTLSRRRQPEDFVFCSRLFQGTKPLDLSAVLKRKIQPAFAKAGVTGVGWHTFRHFVGSMLAEMGEHQLTIRDYLRHANLHVTNKYLQSAAGTKRQAQNKLVTAILPSGLLSKSKSLAVQAARA